MMTDVARDSPAHGRKSRVPRRDADLSRDADLFAEAAILTICSAGTTPSVGLRTAERCMRALAFGGTARMGFRHPAKAEAIDRVWRDRHRLHRDIAASAAKVAFLETLPGIGPVTRRALAERLGIAGEGASLDRAA
ncbi:MAG TPA: hypothetical protein VHK66_02270 [Microvirga sp.]|nr:hypothetical protein [Microvirga sp.]